MKLFPRGRAEEPHETQETGGAKAHEEATRGLADARARWPEVRRVSTSLRELRENNGFLELIENAVQGGRR